ncbi:NAD(P)-dependent oxidoreductase [Oscillospiraceae bacterium MB08-C2-2]|nr:NAD(P)-dependent oxidoreductase [Oscillospiraceae bacterium MB08-C2-2]
MKVLHYCFNKEEAPYFQEVQQKYGFRMDFTEQALTYENARQTAGYDAIWVLTPCVIDDAVAEILQENGVRYVVSRAAGIDHLDIESLGRRGIKAANTPDYSPRSIAEFAVMMALNSIRRTKRSSQMTADLDFRLNGLRGKELGSLYAGVIGTGRIGFETARLLHGFGCRVGAYDLFPSPAVEAYAQYWPLEQLYTQCDILFLHCPLTSETEHMINRESLRLMPKGVYIVNAARGGLVDHEAVLEGLESGQIAGFAFDVYENEKSFIRRKLGQGEAPDSVFTKLIACDNVDYSAHISFFTDQAVENMIFRALENLAQYAQTGSCENELTNCRL